MLTTWQRNRHGVLPVYIKFSYNDVNIQNIAKQFVVVVVVVVVSRDLNGFNIFKQ